MNAAILLDDPETMVDPIEEIRLRTWARQNYLPEQEREEEWHPIILDEMRQKDLELDRIR
ncbi:hypothetical protein AB1L42_13085 [Thalassoglobus sp. JC818]|uniref:hypothetical protein n=1 Tax=Thalassoglobus sp. JC818 TaxID=3232136 RepID=UPI0034577D9B